MAPEGTCCVVPWSRARSLSSGHANLLQIGSAKAGEANTIANSKMDGLTFIVRTYNAICERNAKVEKFCPTSALFRTPCPNPAGIVPILLSGHPATAARISKRCWDTSSVQP